MTNSAPPGNDHEPATVNVSEPWTRAYWARRFGSDPSVLGRAITLDGSSYTIVGVLESAAGPLERNVAVFTAARWAEPKRKGPFFTMALGRLRPGVSRSAAVDTMRATTTRLFPIWKSSYQNEQATWGLLDLKTRVVGDIGATLLVALAAVGCVLLIASANVANLLLARAASRQKEIAVRTAMGASRARLLRQMPIDPGLLLNLALQQVLIDLDGVVGATAPIVEAMGAHEALPSPSPIALRVVR